MVPLVVELEAASAGDEVAVEAEDQVTEAALGLAVLVVVDPGALLAVGLPHSPLAFS